MDDSPEIVEVVSLCLEMKWPDMSVLSAGNGRDALQLVNEQEPDLIILDIGLPDMDGFEVLREISGFSQAPVIMLTVREGDINIVRALQMGADDYMSKPFSHIELQARVQALLRRAKTVVSENSGPVFVCGDVSVDFVHRAVTVKGDPVKLTPIEYNLLYHLVKNRGQVLTHETLLSKVWGPDYADASQYLKVHIQRLRKKLGDSPESPQMILTERGVGYCFADQENK